MTEILDPEIPRINASYNITTIYFRNTLVFVPGQHLSWILNPGIYYLRTVIAVDNVALGSYLTKRLGIKELNFNFELTDQMYIHL